MNISILTLFPQMIKGPLDHSIIRRAKNAGVFGINILDIRDYTHDNHHTTDDYQFGGGPGMVMKPGPVFEAVEQALAGGKDGPYEAAPIILLSPQGRVLNQTIVRELALEKDLVLICGHYEGVDERIRESLATDDISIGDYILTGGELAAMVLVDAVVRLIPGVVGSSESILGDSISAGILQHPIYTRPREYRGLEVPQILTSGDHANVAKWRRQQALLKTLKKRPDLLLTAKLDEDDRQFLIQCGYNPMMEL